MPCTPAGPTRLSVRTPPYNGYMGTYSFFVSYDDQRFIDTKIACFICICHILSPKQVRNTDKQLLKLREQYVQDLRMSECRVIKKKQKWNNPVLVVTAVRLPKNLTSAFVVGYLTYQAGFIGNLYPEKT